MPLFDLGQEELEAYSPQLPAPSDFDSFWKRTIAEAQDYDLNATLVSRPSGLRAVEVFDLTFNGFGGHPVSAWYIRPAGLEESLPGMLGFLGYGAGRGFPLEHLSWPCAGYATLIMDTRGQGSGWGSPGHTPDPVGSAPSGPGFMTRGIEDPEQYYYRRVYTDAIRAIETLKTLPGVDPARISVAGGSQGGGIALATAGLVQDLRGVSIDVPFLCHFRRAVEITSTDPYGEIRRYLSVHRSKVAQVFETLSYFDGVHFAARISAPAKFSVALMDPVCPPSTVYAAYNACPVPGKTMRVFEFNEHEGGGSGLVEENMLWFANLPQH